MSQGWKRLEDNVNKIIHTSQEKKSVKHSVASGILRPPESVVKFNTTRPCYLPMFEISSSQIRVNRPIKYQHTQIHNVFLFFLNQGFSGNMGRRFSTQ